MSAISTSGKSDQTSAKKLAGRRDYAAEMRAKGYKRVVRWVPDMDNPELKAEYMRQVAQLAERQKSYGSTDFLLPEEDLPGWV